MKLISYSLFGSNFRYTDPLIYNAKNLNNYYNGWIMRVYHDDTVPESILKTLSDNDVQLINIYKTDFSLFAPKFWRFLPVLDNNLESVIFRDSDSIFTNREVVLVKDWYESKNDFHIIRDHQLHISPILAGMFGIKKKCFKLFSVQLLNNRSLTFSNSYNADQIFLADCIYKKIIGNCLVHTSFFTFFCENYTRIDKSKDQNNFIGSIYTEREEEIDIIIDYNFMIGVPFWLAKVFRYKVRPVLYLSYIFNLVICYLYPQRHQ